MVVFSLLYILIKVGKRIENKII